MRVIVLLAAGFEELEAVTVIDVLRRAGIEVVAAGLTAGPIRASRGVVLVPDATLDAVREDTFDAVVLPGGMPGSQTLADDARVMTLLQRHATAGALLAAICAAPIVLQAAGLLAGSRYTSHPSVADRLPASGYESAPVVSDGRIVTSRGPGTALRFALALVASLCGDQRAAAIAAPMLVE